MGEHPLVYAGIALWLAAYGLMLYHTLEHGAVTWPLPWAAYSLVWEWLDALNLLGGQTPRKRLFHLGYALLDTALVWGQFLQRPGPTTILCISLAAAARRWPRHYKYFHYVWQVPLHYAEAALPAYQAFPALRLALWLQVLANACYIPKSDSAPEGWKTFYWAVARAMPLWCAGVNLFM